MEFTDKVPVLVVKTVGDSRSAFLGASDLWRWQFRPGENAGKDYSAYSALVDRLLRWLLMGEADLGDRPRLLISQTRIPLGKTIDIGIQYGGATQEATATVHLVVADPNNRVVPLSVRRQLGGFFSTRFTPGEAGEYRFTASDPKNPSASDTVGIQVEPFSIETAVSGAREDLLEDLASKTNGVWVDVKQIGKLTGMDQLDKIYQPRVVKRTVTEPVMSAPWFFIALIFLLGLEWSLRRIKDMP